jgi:hypothetical protein
MEKYELSAKAIYSVLKEKKVEFLYHANTVLTSRTFIKQRALLSRAFVANNNLIQTEQKSDKEDVKFNVWDDIFLDGMDLHKKYNRPNKYGPILFVMKLELLQSPSISSVLVTKTNPWYWKDSDTMDDRYYSDIEDIKGDYLTGKKIDARVMFTFRSPDTAIKLNKFLVGIGIDKPAIILRIKSGLEKNIGDFAFETIGEALNQNGLGHIPIKHRHSDGKFHFCPCNFQYTILYNNDFKEFRKRFKAIPD